MSVTNADYDSLAVEREDGLARIALDAPDRNNTIDAALIGELNDALRRADNDRGVDGILLASTSSEVFCAGADLGELSSLDLEESYRFLSTYTDTVDLLWGTGKPVVAAVAGTCVAGGNELVMGCDLIVAGESARFGQPEATVGSTAAGGGVQTLPLFVGMQRARDMLLTGRLLTAAEAEEWGLVTRVVEDGAVEREARDLVAEIVAGKSPYAYRVMKGILKRWYDTAMAGGVDEQLTAAVWTDEAFRERAASFVAGEDLSPRPFAGTTGSVED